MPPFLAKGLPHPNMSLSVYKIRRGAFVRGFVWMIADKGTCRYEHAFVTDWDYRLDAEIMAHPDTIVTLPWEEAADGVQ